MKTAAGEFIARRPFSGAFAPRTVENFRTN
jgi:hypothetical protein